MKLLVDHVSFTQGARQGSTPGLGISEPSRSLLKRGTGATLYSLCVLDGAAADLISPLVTEVLHTEFAKSSRGSITTALLGAMRAAEYTLCKENARSLPQHRCTGALCAAAVKGNTVYVAHVGSSVALVWQRNDLKLLAGPYCGYAGPWAGEETEIGLTSCQLESGDALILASDGLLYSARDDFFATALARAGTVDLVEALERLYVVSPHPHDFSAVVLSRPAEEARTEATESPAAFAARKPEPADKPDGVQARRAVTEPDPRPDSYRAPAVPGAAEREPRVASGRWDERAAAATAVISDPGEDKPSPWRRAIGLVGPSLVRVLLRFSIALVLIAVLAVAVYVGERMWETRAAQARVEEALVLLEQKENDALATSDPASRRWLLTEADRLAAQALAANPDDERIRAAAQRIRGRLDAVNEVVRLARLQLLADFTSADRSARPAKLVVATNNLYALDPGLGVVWHVFLGQDLGALGAPRMLWRRGAEEGGVTLAEATAMFWMHGGAPGLAEQLYVLDGGGHLVPVEGANLGSPSRLPGAGGISRVRAVAGQGGNFYALDVQRRLVWRYTPGANGYDKAPQEYLTDQHAGGLADAVDLAVDGSLYLLFGQGQVGKYAAGQSNPFPAVVPDAPLRNPSSFFVSPTARNVYVADTGNARVVQFSKEGQYVRQFRAAIDNFDDLRAVAVDEDLGRMYLLVGGRAFVSELPLEAR